MQQASILYSEIFRTAPEGKSQPRGQESLSGLRGFFLTETSAGQEYDQPNFRDDLLLFHGRVRFLFAMA